VSEVIRNPYRNPDEPGFNPAYRGTPPWDIGRPQSEFVRLEGSGEIRGSVLDVGCGTGENVLYFAQRGHDAWGIDTAPLAITRANEKAVQRGVDAHFLVADAFELWTLGRTFDTVVDSGLFHIFDPEAHTRLVKSLASVLSPGGTLFVLGYSDAEQGGGPPGFSPDELHRAFADGWRVNEVLETRFEILAVPNHKSKAWLASITRE
jgi:SAM-dependent methyltransferase